LRPPKPGSESDAGPFHWAALINLKDRVAVLTQIKIAGGAEAKPWVAILTSINM
jgi:hypothetical protein